MCLERLFSQEGIIPKIGMPDVFLVDDGSTDGTGEAVISLYPQVHLIKGDGNLYWNRGMLLAWGEALEKSSCDAVVWLNDDTMLLPNAIQVLTECSTKHPNSIIVGTTKAKDGQLSYGGYQKKGVLLNPEEEEMPCRIFNGNIVLVPRCVSDRIGLLDKKFSHSMGDFEYGRRAHKQGIENFVTPVVGICDRNRDYVCWRDRKYPLVKRLCLLYSPLGNPPFEAFYYIKEDSILKACVVFVYLHFSAIFPSLFKKNSSL